MVIEGEKEEEKINVISVNATKFRILRINYVINRLSLHCRGKNSVTGP